jgi:hypothetical protein
VLEIIYFSDSMIFIKYIMDQLKACGVKTWMILKDSWGKLGKSLMQWLEYWESLRSVDIWETGKTCWIIYKVRGLKKKKLKQNQQMGITKILQNVSNCTDVRDKVVDCGSQMEHSIKATIWSLEALQLPQQYFDQFRRKAHKFWWQRSSENFGKNFNYWESTVLTLAAPDIQ